jgi:hypothetical protein
MPEFAPDLVERFAAAFSGECGELSIAQGLRRLSGELDRLRSQGNRWPQILDLVNVALVKCGRTRITLITLRGTVYRNQNKVRPDEAARGTPPPAAGARPLAPLVNTPAPLEVSNPPPRAPHKMGSTAEPNALESAAQTQERRRALREVR